MFAYILIKNYGYFKSTLRFTTLRECGPDFGDLDPTNFADLRCLLCMFLDYYDYGGDLDDKG